MRCLASKSVGGSHSTNNTLWIGMSHMEYGVTVPVASTSPNLPREGQVSRPSASIVFADAGAVTAATAAPAPDDWLPDLPFDAASLQTFGGGVRFFRVPSDGNYAGGDSRSLPRHNKRCNFGFFDGHAEALKNSKAGYNYIRTDENAWWARNHDSLTP